MHIPDGFLSANVWALGWLISIAGISCLKASKILKDRMIPLMGVMASLFLLHRYKFPIFGGFLRAFTWRCLATVLRSLLVQL